MVAKNSVTIENTDSPTAQLHKNKLTQCFDDMLKMSTEMLVQEQLKTIQLDNSITNGFSAEHQKNLKEKFHMFHGILDDLDITLDKCASYVETLNKIGLEKEETRKKEAALEEERKKKKLEEEQEKQRLAKEKQQREKEQKEKEKKELLEKKKKEEEETKAKQSAAAAAAAATSAAQTTVGTSSNNPLDLMDDMQLSFDDNIGMNVDSNNNDNNNNNNKDSSITAGFGNELGSNKPGILAVSTDANDIDPLTSLVSPIKSSDKSGDNSTTKDDTKNRTNTTLNENGSNSVFNDLDNMDMSLFTDLDNTNFDPLADTLTGTADLISKPTGDNNINNNNSSGNTNDAKKPTTNENSSKDINLTDSNVNPDANNLNDGLNMMDPLQDMGDDYLTLNDFNDLNIDWNAGGDSGDLDLNDFNI